MKSREQQTCGPRSPSPTRMPRVVVASCTRIQREATAPEGPFALMPSSWGLRLQRSGWKAKQNGQTYKIGICVGVSCVDSLMPDVCACPHEPCWGFRRLRLLLSTTLAPASSLQLGEGGSSTTPGTLLAAGKGLGSKPGADPPRRSSPTLHGPGLALSRGLEELSTSACTEPCRAGPRPASLHSSDHIDQGSSVY